eukprot:CAMPEP_0113850328 /NCGR_PEP_ID=MMETSP0372-20130328/3798_1 /TAXON_ID=340204 /ORGANISM="Lankesteria abbotti" /LENGTH=106 /DNA_ID=CAMNT_0000820563 /DNA_START=13 /DNA_END=330 /DNA_ORIENTATION=+ /assembly_acc=CAM_ASM_000359
MIWVMFAGAVQRFVDFNEEEIVDFALCGRLLCKAMCMMDNGVTAANHMAEDVISDVCGLDRFSVHFLPRRRGDFAVNDDIYDEMRRFKFDGSHCLDARGDKEMEEE